MLPIDNSTASKYIQDNFLDANSLSGVKAMGRDQDPQALKEIAKKFEAIFLQQMLKNMRAANEVFAEDSYFNSNETQFHQDMLDQQMSLEMTNGRGLGLADALYAQMQRAYGNSTGSNNTKPAAIETTDMETGKNLSGTEFSLEQAQRKNSVKDLADGLYRQQLAALLNEKSSASAGNSAASSLDAALLASVQAERARVNAAANAQVTPEKNRKSGAVNSPTEFIAALKPHAQKAAAELNINPDVLLAQAALETGWGQHVIHNTRGDNSFNVFNIKADARWSGQKVNVTTLEYNQGIARQERADFRRYDNYAESFSDYVNFLQANPRYQPALAVGDNSSAYADALQAAGYATDPAYAEKIKQLLDSAPIRAATETLVNLASTHHNET